MGCGEAFNDPLAAFDPGGLIYKSDDPEVLAMQGNFDIGGIGAKPVVAGNVAAEQQQQAAGTAIGEQRRQFDTMVGLMSPYTQAGVEALGGQQNLLGLGGDQAQQEAINSIMQSPQYKSMMESGQSSILQSASATGGLRGGDVQGAMAQFGPQVLSNLINQQYGRLGGIAGLGQASAAGQAAAGQTSTGSITDLMQQQAAATAGATLNQANQQQQTTQSLLPLLALLF